LESDKWLAGAFVKVTTHLLNQRLASGASSSLNKLESLMEDKGIKVVATSLSLNESDVGRSGGLTGSLIASPIATGCS
jgi:hypothetical protein